MKDETNFLRQRVSQLESDVRGLRAALAQAQALSGDNVVRPIESEDKAAPLAKKRGRPPKAKE